MKKAYIIPTTSIVCSDIEQAILAGSNPFSGVVEPTNPDTGLGTGGTITGGGNGDNVTPAKNRYSVWDWTAEDFEDDEDEKKR